MVQTIDPLPDGGELFVTWSQTLAPLGWPIQGLGVLPQVCTSLGQEALNRQLASLSTGFQPMAAAIRRSRAARIPVPASEVLEIRAPCPASEGRAGGSRGGAAADRKPSGLRGGTAAADGGAIGRSGKTCARRRDLVRQHQLLQLDSAVRQNDRYGWARPSRTNCFLWLRRLSGNETGGFMSKPIMPSMAGSPASRSAFRGVFPVMPTVFDDRGELDLDGQRRAADFMIDAGSEGICNSGEFLRTVRAGR